MPTRAQKPLGGLGEPNVGRFGQKTQRPKITSSAGSRVTMTSTVTADADGEHRAEAGGGVELGEG